MAKVQPDTALARPLDRPGSSRAALDAVRELAGPTTNLLRTMHARDVRKLVFSSSCSIYGGPVTTSTSWT